MRKKCCNRKGKVAQIMPATGWRAVYVRDDFNMLHTEELSVVGWGLIQRDNQNAVELLHWDHQRRTAVPISDLSLNGSDQAVVILAPGEPLPEDDILGTDLFGHRYSAEPAVVVLDMTDVANGKEEPTRG